MAKVPFETMKSVIKTAMIRAGLSQEQADICAQIHTESSCDGVFSHGLNRVPRFVDYVTKGWVDVNAKMEEVSSFGCVKIFDAHQGIAIINSLQAVKEAIALAQKHGMGIVGLRNSTHWMRGGTYGWKAVEQGYAFMGWTNTESCMPAWGAKNNRVGNNPFVMAVPCEGRPMVLDMAMSQFSYGKLQVTRLAGQKLPFPGGFDKDGNLTNDPGLIEESMRILPAGYWKGSGLAVMLDAMSAFLTSGLPTAKVDEVGKGSCTGANQIFMLFDPQSFGGKDVCQGIVRSVEDYVHSSQADSEGGLVAYPGERTLQKRKQYLKEGIPADDSVWEEVKKLAGM